MITQGRGDCDQWVTGFLLKTSDNGVDWKIVDEGRVFKGNSDRTTKVRNEIKNKPTSRILRLCPIKW